MSFIAARIIIIIIIIIITMMIIIIITTMIIITIIIIITTIIIIITIYKIIIIIKIIKSFYQLYMHFFFTGHSFWFTWYVPGQMDQMEVEDRDVNFWQHLGNSTERGHTRRVLACQAPESVEEIQSSIGIITDY